MTVSIPNHALICGLLRDELEFRITLAQVIDARSSGLFKQIILSTWYGEIDRISGLRNELYQHNITVVESAAPGVKTVGNVFSQHKAMYQGLRFIPDGEAVWRIRTDRTAHLLKLFLPLLKTGPSPCRSFGGIPSVFKKRVAAQAVVSTVPFYAADFAFYGLKEDLLNMVNFDGVYDCLFRGFGAEHRIWTNPFLKVYPQLFEVYEHFHLLGLSTHVVIAALNGKPIPDFLLRLYAFYWIMLYNNIQIIEARDSYKGGVTLYAALGGEKNDGIRTGVVASNFTVNVATFNDQNVLDDLVTKPLDDQTDTYKKYAAILQEFKENGADALPVWTDAVAEEVLAMHDPATDGEFLYRSYVVSNEDKNKETTPTDVKLLSGDRFRDFLLEESGALSISSETLKVINDVLKLTEKGYDTGRLYLMIAEEIFKSAHDDRSQKKLGGFFLLRAAQRGNVEAAGKYGWLVYSGRLEVSSRDDAVRWACTAAVKENPLAQYTCSLMHKNGWVDTKNEKEATVWHEKALKNGFSSEMLSF